MESLERLILADDLTGANDTGVHFLSGDEKVEVVIDAGKFSTEDLNHDIHTLVVNTNSRNYSPAESARLVRTYLDEFLAFSPREIYKKIDSTLRGNVGAEIDAVMTTSGYTIACVAPAVPRNGRTTINGICYVHGVPLYATEFAKDPFSPVESSDARSIISRQTARKTGIFTLENIRLSKKEALSHLQVLIDDGYEIIVVDSQTRDDLLRVQELFSSLGRKVLYVGAAGFFHAIRKVPSKAPQRTFPHGLKTLFVTGSMMETSKHQCNWLIQKGYLNTAFTVISKQAISDGPAEIRRVANAVSSEFKYSDIALILTDRNRDEIAQTAGRVGHVISRIVSEVVKSTHIDVLVVTGGETAMNILCELKVNSLQLIDEALPAVPVSIMQSPENGELMFISKAGSYGDIDVLEGIITYVEKLNHGRSQQEIDE